MRIKNNLLYREAVVQGTAIQTDISLLKGL